jgi:hypothetical protein
VTARGTPTRTKSNVSFPKRRHAPTLLPSSVKAHPPIPPAQSPAPSSTNSACPIPSSSKSPNRRRPSDSRRLYYIHLPTREVRVSGSKSTGFRTSLRLSESSFPGPNRLVDPHPSVGNDVLLQPAPRSKATAHLRLVCRILEQLRAELVPCLQRHLMHLSNRLRGFRRFPVPFLVGLLHQSLGVHEH